MVSKAAEQACLDFLRLVDEALFLAARDASNNLEETRYLDGQNEIRRRGEQISEQIPELLRKGISILNSPLSNLEPVDEPSSLSELSLIDKDEFEEFLSVSQLVSELEPRFKETLYNLERRLSVLANRDVDERTNPIGPAVVCGAFAEGLKNLESDRTAVNVICRTLGKALELNLARLYEKVNELLVEFGILPVVEKEKPKIKRAPGSDTDDPAQIGTLEATQVDDTIQPPDARTQQPFDQSGHHPAYPQGGVGQQPFVQAAPPPPVPATASGAPGGFDVIDPAASAPHPNVGAYSQQGAPPAYGYGGQVAQPGAGVPGQMPAGQMPAGQVAQGQVSPGQIPSGEPGPGAGQGGPVQVGVGLEATFGGFGAGPAIYVPPSLQQAYSAAQTQMALRRELLPAAAREAASPDLLGRTYAPAQVIDGLTHLQQSLASTLEPQMLDVHGIKDRIVDAITGSGGDAGAIGQNETDAIEVIANLFEVLIQDALLTDNAKSHLTRLQAPVHKAALMDQSFFEATDHPVRQLLNRVSMLRDSQTEEGAALNDRVSSLIGQLNSDFHQDMDVVQPILTELDQFLREQRDAYDENVVGVVNASEEQQKILEARRDKNLETTDSGSAQIDLPEEWNRWLDRSKLLEIGERLIMNANTKTPFLVTLVWIGPEFKSYVFVDDKGDKSSTLTLQQVAMYLRRGTLKQLHGDDGSAVDRALFGVVNRMHGEVEAHATHDELTEFMNRKTFLQVVERHLPDRPVSSGGPALCQIGIDNLKEINVRYGVETGDMMINLVAEILQETIRGKAVSFGRIGGTELGVFWQKGGLQSAYKKIQNCFEKLSGKSIEKDGETLPLVAYAGITSVEDGLTSANQLLNVVNDACGVAKSANDKPIYVAGSENKYREQLEQMVSYIGKAYDRERLVLLHQTVRSLVNDTDLPAMHMLVTAEDRNGKLVPPGFFTQALANFERAFEVDKWILKRTLGWMAANPGELDNFAAVIVPLSHEAVKRDELSNLIINELMETAVPPAKIFFEIADKDALANVTETAELVRTLKEFGCRFILDEFGTGQGNYDYVKELAVDFVTIQSAYIAEATQNPKDFAMAKSINELVHFMGKQTIGKQVPIKTSTNYCARSVSISYTISRRPIESRPRERLNKASI